MSCYLLLPLNGDCFYFLSNAQCGRSRPASAFHFVASATTTGVPVIGLAAEHAPLQTRKWIDYCSLTCVRKNQMTASTRQYNKPCPQQLVKRMTGSVSAD